MARLASPSARRERGRVRSTRTRAREAEAVRAGRAVAAQTHATISIGSEPASRVDIAGSPGDPLPTWLRTRIEHSFGADLARVRIHNDAAAIRALRDACTRGFAAGRDVFVDLPTHDFGSERGLGLLGHEIAHVLQQTGRRGPRGVAATAISGDASREPQHDDEFITRLVDKLVDKVPPDYKDFKQLYAATDAKSKFADVDAIVGDEWHSNADSGAKLAKLVTDPSFAKLAPDARAFIADCAKILGQYDVLTKRAVTKDGIGERSMFRSAGMYRAIRKTGVKWITDAIELLPNLGKRYPEALLAAVRGWLFSIEKRPDLPSLEDPWFADLTWVRAGRGEALLAATDAVTSLYVEIIWMLSTAAHDHAELTKGGGAIEFRRDWSNYLANLKDPKPDVVIEVPEYAAMVEAIWPKIQKVAGEAETYWKEVISLRDALLTGTSAYVNNEAMSKEEVAALGAALPADPMFPMFGKTLVATTKTLLDRKLSAAEFSKAVTERSEKHAALHKSFDQIRRARADKHKELGEDGVKLGAAAALLARVVSALAKYDAAKDAEESLSGRDDQRFATQIRIAELALDLSSVLALPSLAKLASDFLGDRPLIAITGEWTETKANSVDHFRVDMRTGLRFMGTPMTVDEITEWVEAGRNLILLGELLEGMKATPSQDKDSKSILDTVMATREGGSGLHKFELGANQYEAWFDPKWIDPTTYEVKDEQSFANALFGAAKTKSLLATYDTHEGLSHRQIPRRGTKLWVWLVPRIDAWIEKIIADAALKKELDYWRDKTVKPEWRSWMNAITYYVDYLKSDPDKQKLLGDRIKKIAADERLSSQNELARQARLAAAAQIRSWLVGYDASQRQPWWVPNRVWREIYNFSTFIIGRPEEQRHHVAALVLDLAPELSSKFTPPRNEADNAIGVGAMLVSGVISQWEAKGSAKVIQSLLPEYQATDIVGRVDTLRALGKVLREAARAVQTQGGIFADQSDQSLKTKTYSAKVYQTTQDHPERGFAWQETFWRIRKVHKSFWYHPSYPYLENDLGFAWPDGASWIRQGLIEDENGMRLTGDEPLLTISKTNLHALESEELVLSANNWVQLGHVYHDLSYHALFSYLDATGKLIEAGFWFVWEIAELIPGIGQGLMAVRFATSVIDFLMSPEFAELMSAIGKDGLSALTDKLTKLPITLDQLVGYLLFTGVKWMPDVKVDDTRSAQFTTSSSPWAALAKALKNIIYIVKRIVASIQKVRSVVQVPFRATQVFVLEHPLVSLLVGLAIDHIDDLKNLSIDKIMDIFTIDEKEFKEAAKKGANQIVDGAALAFTNLRFLQVPSEIIRLDFIVETIFNVLVSRMGPKFKLIGGGVREVLKATHLWGKVTSAVGKQLGKFVDPNEPWRDFIQGPLSKRIAEVRDAIAGEIKGGIAEIPWLSVDEPTKYDMTITPSGEDFDNPEPSPDPAANAAPFLEDDPDALSRWKSRPAIAIPATGSPLDTATRQRGESTLGQDLGHVRLHTGAEGARGTPPGARAVTAGSHVFLGPTVDRMTPSGESVLFHELAHVLQQSGPRPLGQTQSTVPVMPRMTGMVWNEAAEAAADRAATGVDAGTIARVARTSVAGLQPFPTTTAKAVLKNLISEEQVKTDALHYVTADVQARAQADSDQDNINKVTAAVYGAIAAKIDKIDADKKSFTRPFELVRPQIQAILVKHKPDIEKAIRAIVFWKGALDKKNVFVVAPKTLARELERYLFGAIGIASQIVFAAKDDNVLLTGDIVKSFDFGYVDLIELGADGDPLITLALENSHKTVFGSKTKRRSFIFDKTNPQPWIVATKLMLKRKRSLDLWNKKKFAFHEDALNTLATILEDMDLLVKADPWPSADVYANPDKPSDPDLVKIGLRVGTYGEQAGWIAGSGRDSHHVLQVAFIEYLQNAKAGAKPFPGLDTHDKAYKNLGIEASGDLATKITGPDGSWLDVSHLASGARADPMPTIFLSNYTHRTKIHLHSDEGLFTRMLLDNAFHANNAAELKLLDNPKVLETIGKTSDPKIEIDMAGTKMSVGALHEIVYRAARHTYGVAWSAEHQARLRTNVGKFEPLYYNAVVAERQRTSKPVPAQSTLDKSLTDVAVDRVIGDVDKIVGAHKFKPL